MKQDLMFKDEKDAARKLYEALHLSDIIRQKPLLLASSLESVFLVNELATLLKLNYEIIFAEKIYSPINSECLIAMVSETKELVFIGELVNSFEISLDYIYGEANRKYDEKILKNIYKYRKGKLVESFAGRDIILIDEGCESGLTALVCLKSILSLEPNSVAYATPVIASDVAIKLSSVVDQIFTVEKIADFVNVDFYYEKKESLKADEILKILEDSQFYLPLQKEKIKREENDEV